MAARGLIDIYICMIPRESVDISVKPGACLCYSIYVMLSIVVSALLIANEA